MAEVPAEGSTWPLWADRTGPDDPALLPCLVPGGGPRAAVVVCPGGGYAHLAPHEGLPVARWLNGLGLHAFVLRYRVAPHRHPAPLQDAQRALRTVRCHAADWGVDPGRVGILGFSAGGHLAATAGTGSDPGSPEAQDPVERCSCRPDLMVLCYAVLTFGPFREPGTLRNLLGPEPDEALRRALSPEERVSADSPPTFLWHTADDRAVPAENSLGFAAALSRVGVPWSLHVFPHGRHGLGLASADPEAGAWTDLCASWLAARGWCPPGVGRP